MLKVYPKIRYLKRSNALDWHRMHQNDGAEIPGDGVEYMGYVDSEMRACGTGRVINDKGEIYEGTFFENKLNGHCVKKKAVEIGKNGIRQVPACWISLYVDDKPHGRCTYYEARESNYLGSGQIFNQSYPGGDWMEVTTIPRHVFWNKDHTANTAYLR